MKLKILFIGFFLFCFGISLAQKETRAVKKIKKISYKINSLLLEFKESEFKLDSIMRCTLLPCLAYPSNDIDFNKLFGYSEIFTEEFLKDLSDEILQKLNE